MSSTVSAVLDALSRSPLLSCDMLKFNPCRNAVAQVTTLGWFLWQEAGVAEDEVKYGAAARLAALDADLLDQQQEMALCLQAHRAALDQQLEHAQTQLAASEVITIDHYIIASWHH